MRRSVSLRLRFRVLRRSRFRCHYCGAGPTDRPLEVDHVVPVARGGTNAEANLVAACFDCNRGKADTEGETFDAWLRRQAGREDVVGDLADDHVREPLGETATLRGLLQAVRLAAPAHAWFAVQRAAWHAWREWKRGHPTRLLREMKDEYLERIHRPGVCWTKDGIYMGGRRGVHP